MIAVIFEVEMPAESQAEYLDWAAELRPLLDRIDGFLSVLDDQETGTTDVIIDVSGYYR